MAVRTEKMPAALGSDGRMGLRGVLRWKSRELVERLESRAETLSADIRGRGVNVWSSSRGLNLRLLPPAALKSWLSLDLDIIGAALTASRQGVGFVQVGAFDGFANDPIHDLVRHFGWQGVLVEPQPDAFQRLRENYAGVEGLVFLNAAIADARGTMTLWRISGDEAGDPWWRGQVSSFDRDHVLKHIRHDERLAARLVGEPVQTLTINDVFERSPRPVDVLQVDAEGHDASIVTSLDFGTHRPTVIRFEHRHLTAHQHEMAVNVLVRHGYRIAVNEDDTIAMRHEPGRGSTATS